MKKGWEEISVGDVITIKRKDKFICVFASDVPAHPITKGETIEVVDFFSNNIRTYNIDHDDYINIDAPYYEAINYRLQVGSLVEIRTGKKEKILGTIVSTHPPVFKAYPDHHRTLVHTFFTPQYNVMLTDGSEITLEEPKLRTVSNLSN